MRAEVPRVLLVCPQPPPWGGISKWTIVLTAWLERRGGAEWRVLDTAPRWRAVSQTGLIRRAMGGGLQGLRDALRAFTQMLRFRPQVVHVTTSGSLAFVRDVVIFLLARLLGVAALQHLRMGRLPEVLVAGGWEAVLFRTAGRLAHGVIAIDQASAAAARSALGAAKVRHLPNAIDLRELPGVAEPASGARMHPLPSGMVGRALFVGWLVPTKGTRELMRAWSSMGQPDWELVVIGPGDDAYRKELAGLAGEDRNVRFLPEMPHEEVWKWMCSADLFVLPTYTEGFPNVILEAMAAGLPIVTTPVGAIPEMLDAGGPEPAGRLVAVGEVAGLAEAMRHFMTDPGDRARQGQRGRKKVERVYDVDVVFAEYVALWRELAESRVRRDEPPAEPEKVTTKR